MRGNIAQLMQQAQKMQEDMQRAQEEVAALDWKELDRAAGIEAGLEAYEARRYDRCRHVVETSIAVGKMQLAGDPPEAVGAALGAGLHRLANHY